MYTNANILAKESPEWVIKLKSLVDAKQIVVISVKNSNESVAEVSMHEKNEGGRWEVLMETAGYIGKNGLGKVKEGDNKTPRGVFRFTCTFGIADPPSDIRDGGFIYKKVDGNKYWSGDSKIGYNKMVDVKNCPGLNKNDSEHLIDYKKQYQYCLNINYNIECIPGKGSAIFFHCKGNYGYTGGCVAVPEECVLFVVRNAIKDCVVIIDTEENIKSGNV